MIVNVTKITTNSIEETINLGREIGFYLNTGTILALIGDLGSGKTAFVQGLAKGLKVPEKYYITSPTYTIINEYPGRLKLFHVDLYRIQNPVDYYDVGLHDILASDGVAAIEWAGILCKELLSEYIKICFEITDDNSRDISIANHGIINSNLNRLFDRLSNR